MTSPVYRDARPALFLIAALVILIDRLTKMWIVAHLRLGQTINVITGVFRISHVMNTGAAFSLFAEQTNPRHLRWGLEAFSIMAIVAVLVLLFTAGRRFTLTTLAFALILGGAIGNLYDRFRYEFVTDFLEVKIVHYHWPDFNFADSCITIAACLLVIEIFKPTAETAEPE
jgi:signal peptidase II